MVYRLLRLPAEFHAQRGASMLAQRAFLTDQLSVGVSAVTVTASAGILMSVLATIVLILMDLPAGLLAAVLAISTALVLRTSVLRTRDEASRVVREMVEVGSLMSSSLSQIESIKASGNEDGIVARGIAAENRLIEAQQRIGERSMRLTILPMLMGGIGYVLIAAVAAYRVTQGAIDPGSFLAILALSAIVIGPMSQVVLALDQAQTLRASLDQVDDVLETDEDPQFSVVLEGDVPAVLRGELQLQDVSFGYSRLAPPVISEINLHVQPGRRVALVGPSGCGKSTVSRLVTGLYSPWSGEVRIDGRLRLEHSREVLTDDIALVDQNLAIFAGTIRENVTLWDTTVPEEDILAAIQDAQLGEDVARRPGGLDAVLTEGGADLSGGQRQRLEIARALVRNPAVLVMDEATSALDPITEMLIDKAIRRRGITCLVIAHRLSTIRDSDEIVVLSRGVVVERGTHDELMALEGEYQALVGSG
jgi:ABC-type bacteriocin/lantibiotic exporter with double-glycine peptidase domain